jgi:hypothetical protein
MRYLREPFTWWSNPLWRQHPRLIPSLLVTLCAGCTVLTSETLEQVKGDERAPRGLYYALPMGSARATLTVLPSKTEFSLTITQGDNLPDPNHRYFLQYRSNPAYKDDVTAVTNEKGLLTSVTSTTEDMTPQIIVDLVKGVTGLGLEAEVKADKVEQPLTLYNELFDPSDAKHTDYIRSEIDSKIASYLGVAGKTCAYFADTQSSVSGKALKTLEVDAEPFKAAVHNLTTQKAVIEARLKKGLEKAGETLKDLPTLNCKPEKKDELEKDVALICTLREQLTATTTELAKKQQEVDKRVAAAEAVEAQQAAQKAPCKVVTDYMKAAPRTTIIVQPSPQEIAERRRRPAVARDCRQGLCYRPKETFRIEYSLDGGFDAVNIDLPNAADVVVIDIRRAFLVQKVQNMTFSEGYLTQLHIKKGSELAALAAIPANVLNAVGEGLALNVNITTAQKNIVAEEVSLLKARKTLRDAMPKSGLESAQRSPLAARGATSRSVAP